MGGDDDFHDAPEHLSRTNSARSSASKLSSSSAYFDAPEDIPAPGALPLVLCAVPHDLRVLLSAASLHCLHKTSDVDR